MSLDLEQLRRDVEEYIAQTGIVVFRGVDGPLEPGHVFWDRFHEPDFRRFLDVAKALEVKLLVVATDTFTQGEIDDVREQLEIADLDRDEQRGLERRVSELQKYEGFTSRLSMWFRLDGTNYSFSAQADWYVAWEELAMEIETYTMPMLEEPDDEDDDGGMGGYYSAN